MRPRVHAPSQAALFESSADLRHLLSPQPDKLRLRDIKQLRPTASPLAPTPATDSEGDFRLPVERLYLPPPFVTRGKWPSAKPRRKVQ